MKRLPQFKPLYALTGAAVALLSILTVLAQSVPQPALTIVPTGTNQFLLTITNGVTYTNYEIYRAPVLNNLYYPFTLHLLGTNGQTNFLVDMGDTSMGMFKAKIATSANGIPDWMWADPNNPALGPLSITIDSPLNGAVIQ